MKIAIFYTTINKSTKKSCKILADKIKVDVKMIPIEKAKNQCILKYNYIILASSAINSKVQNAFKLFVSHNMKNLKEKPLGLIINCEEEYNRFNKTFSQELVDSSKIYLNFGYELDPDEGNYIEKRKTTRLIKKYEQEQKELPSLNLNEINKFADYMNDLIDNRID